MDTAINVMAAAGPFVLTLMGSYMALRPPDPRGRGHWIWLVVFLLFGFPVSTAAFLQMQENDHLNGDTNNRVQTLQADFNDLKSRMAAIARVSPQSSADAIAAALKKQIATAVKDAESSQILTIQSGVTFNVPPISCVIDVRSVPGKRTLVYLPPSPFKGEVVEVQNNGTASHTAETPLPIMIYGNGHKIGQWDSVPILTAGGTQKMIFNGTLWSMSQVN